MHLSLPSSVFWVAIAVTTISIPLVASDPTDSLLDVYESMTIDMDPVDYTIHDPSQIITVGNKQLIAVTGKAQEDGYDCGLETWWRSFQDGMWSNWIPGQCLFREKPDWVDEETPRNDGAFWAPELDLVDGRLTLLYSISEMTEEDANTCVGVAYSVTGLLGFPNSLEWEDSGDALTCIIGADYDLERSAIDPSVFWGLGENADRLFLVTGGGRIIGTELDPDTYQQKDGEWFDLEEDDWTELAAGPYEGVSGSGSGSGSSSSGSGSSEEGEQTWVEAAYIFPNPETGYYYLFVNWGACCSGIDSTYEIVVGRSRDPMGPYLDRDGRDMMDGYGSLVEDTDGYVIGPGHTGIWKDGDDYILSYHYYDRRREGNSWIAEKQIAIGTDEWPETVGQALRTFPVRTRRPTKRPTRRPSSFRPTTFKPTTFRPTTRRPTLAGLEQANLGLVLP